MADAPDLGEIVRRTVQANARFYQGWVDLSLQYLRGISEIFGGVTPAVPEPAPAETDDQGSGVLVLEGEAGAEATGAFLVSNDLGRNLACELVTGGFTDAGGEQAPAAPRFEPPRLELAPGEQRVVQVTIPIDGKLTPGVAYSGQFSVKGLEGFAIPVVLRRRHRVDESPIDRELPTDVIKDDVRDRVPDKGKVPRAKPGGKQPPAGKQSSRRRR